MIDVSEYTKDQLAEFVKTLPGNHELDMRKKIETLREQVVKMQSAPSLLAIKEVAKVTATHIKNKSTGFVFEFTPVLLDHLGENGMLCDVNGEEVK